MFKTHGDKRLSLGFATWRFTKAEDSLVLALKGTFRLVHRGQAELVDPERVTGDEFASDDPLTSACTYPSDVVPFKPKADAMLVGKVHTPGGQPLAQCSATFSVGKSSMSLLVTGDRYWIDASRGVASDPRPFTEMDLGYERAFGGAGWAANPSGKGVAASDARGAIERPLPNVENPSELVRRASDRPPPAGFGPLSPHWSHRMSRWPAAPSNWTRDRWPLPPEALDYSYFNAAQPILQIDGYLRGDEGIVCENLHAAHRRYECALPRLRPRAFVLDRSGDGERFREVGLRLDTLFVDMEAEKLVLVWRGALPVASEWLDEVDHVHLAIESFDDPRAPIEAHRVAFEAERLEPMEPAAAPRNDNDAPAEEPPIAPAVAPPPPSAEAMPEDLRLRFGALGVPDALIAAAERGDLETVEAWAQKQAGATPAQLDEMRAKADKELREAFLKAGHDPKLLEPTLPRPKPPKPDATKPARWTRERVEAHLLAGVPFDGADLSELDLSKLDFRERDLSDCILKGADLSDARLEGAKLAGATMSGVKAAKVSFAGADLSDADLTGAVLEGAVLSKAKLASAIFVDAALAGAKLDGVEAEGALFHRADLTGADLSTALLRMARFDEARAGGAVFRGADLTRASAEGMKADDVDLRGAVLERFNASENSSLARARLDGCRAPRANFMGADLTGARLDRSDLCAADFSRANLGGANLANSDCCDADFTRAKLVRTIFDGANLRACRLEGADMLRASLRGASMYQANLFRARLEGADLTSAFTSGTLLESPVGDWMRRD